MPGLFLLMNGAVVGLEEQIKHLLPIVSLSVCFGVLFIGILIFSFIFAIMKDKLYLAALGIAVPGLLFIGCELLLIVSYYFQDVFCGRQLHRLQSVAICLMIFFIPYFIYHLVRANPIWKKINRILTVIGLVVALLFVAAAFLVPDLFVSQTNPPDSSVNLSWREVRGNAGPLFRLREIIVTPLTLYMIAALVYDLVRHRRYRYLIFPVIGAVCAIVLGYFDYLRLYGSDSGLAAPFYANKYLSYYSIGITLFAALSMVGTVRILLDQVKESERARKLESVGMLAAGIAHDFNNMLTVILGNISLAANSIQDPECRELLKDSQKASLSAKNLTNQLLTFSKGGVLSKNIGTAKDIIMETSNFVLRGSNVKCLHEIPPDLKNADIDAGLLTQVIQNIVLNAKQAMPGGGTVTIRARNENRPKRKTQQKKTDREFIHISIHNDGAIIPRRLLSRIFEPYFTTRIEGQGLGLFLVYSIVKNHSGHLSVFSREKEGTTFEITLPAIEAKKEPARKTVPLPAGRTNLRLLVMDDDSGIRKMLSKLLKKMGHEAVTAANGSEAVRIFANSLAGGPPIQGMILDLTIPAEMGGLEAAEKIRRMDKNVKIIASSGYSDNPVGLDAAAYGFDAFLVKPYTLEEFRNTLDSVGLR